MVPAVPALWAVVFTVGSDGQDRLAVPLVSSEDIRALWRF